MDILSSQANLAGYKAVIEAFQIYERAIPMMMTAAGTIPAAKVLVVGAGVAGLQAIATAKRMGAIVFATDVITSEIIQLEGVDLTIDAERLPFLNKSLDVIILLNVIHHIPNTEKFLSECYRALKYDGQILLIEPANTWFSKIIYKNFHHEDFDENGGWHLKKNGGRLSNANQAIPYIIFERDLKIFKEKFNGFSLIKKYKFKPIHYVLSGGFSYEPIFNNKIFLKIIRIIEFILSPFNNFLGLFMFIKIKKIQ
ncbi:methyltransferase domain-containing protein [Candidatus Pelagibacter sp.]|nr:methyltransferase domain-containing protein [Candidatus Pelagibacter sp.]